MKEKISMKNISVILKSIYYAFQKIINYMLCGKKSFKQELIEVLIIRYGYLVLSVLVLNGQWYQGYGSYGVQLNWWKEILSSIAFFCLFYVYKRYEVKGTFINAIKHLLFIVYFIPMNCTFSINNCDLYYFILTNIYLALLLVIMSYISKKIENTHMNYVIKSDDKKLLRRELIGFFIFICIIFIIHKIDYNGFDISLDIMGEQVYTNRADYQTYLQSISGTLFSYILSIVRYLVTYVAPFLMMYGLLNNKKSIVIISLLTSLSMFSVSNEKNSVLLPIVVLGVYILSKTELLSKFDRVVNTGIIGLFIICLLEKILLNSSRIYFVLIRRIMYIPAWLNTLYFDFFNGSEKVLWSQSVILFQKIFTPVYEVSPLQLISDAYFQGTIPSPNTGLFAEAYMHFGAVGIIIYPLLLAILLVVSEIVLRKYNTSVRILIACQLILTITNVPITRTDFVLSYVLMIFVLMIAEFFYVKKTMKTSKSIRDCQLAEETIDNSKCMVSIICAAYNHEKYIRQALDGFIMQKTDFKFEVIIHDDASTDSTAEIIREYEKMYPNIIKPIYQKENQYSQGINIDKCFLLPNAKGKYIACCEGDDFWIDPNKLQKQVDFLEKNPAYSATAHNCIFVNSRGEKIECIYPVYRSYVEHTYTLDRFSKDVVYPGQTATIVYRRSALLFGSKEEENDYYAIRYSNQDKKTILKLLLSGDIFCFEEAMSAYRIVTHEGDSWSASNYGKNLSYILHVISIDFREFVHKYGKCSFMNYYTTFHTGVAGILKAFIRPTEQNRTVYRLIVEEHGGVFGTLVYMLGLGVLSVPLYFLREKERKKYDPN